MNIQPKPYMAKIRTRKQAFGNERRRNMDKIILEKGTPFPKPIEYSDIDKEFERWVNSLELSYEGKRLPIFKLYSNQRIGEYSQSWQHLDEVGNLLLNFLAITRDNNPKHGEMQGGNYNIPGNHKYPIAIVPTLLENGEEAYDMYSIHQPFCVDFNYKVTLVTNQYELLNKANQTILNEFKSLECYIAPNGHYMPMSLQDISDESEYAIDDRKYYSQTYNITLKGYIIRKEDMEVTKLPYRVMATMLGIKSEKPRKAKIQIEEYECDCELQKSCNNRSEEQERYEKKEIKLEINFPLCEFKTSFEIDTTFDVEEIETNNIYDFVMKINNEYVNFDEDIHLENGDEIYIEIERKNKLDEASIILIGHSDEIIDTMENKEIFIDETPVGEEIVKNV